MKQYTKPTISEIEMVIEDIIATSYSGGIITDYLTDGDD